MRDVINISLPPVLSREVRKAVKGGKYASTSEFFRDILRAWLDEQARLAVRQSEKEFKMGKGKKLRSLRDLR